MSVPVTPQDFTEIRWHGHWIWVPEEPVEIGSPFGGVTTTGKLAHALFRKTFHLDRVPERAPARLTADSRYALFVNGKEIARGPVRSQPRRLYYDMVDLAPALQQGTNILAVYVKYYGTANAYWMPAAPNMTLGKNGVLVFEANLGDAGWLTSDAGWKARKAGAWDSGDSHDAANLVIHGVPVEVFDARRFPQNWRDASFDDSDWGDAHTVPAMHIGGFARTQPPTDPYGPLYPRPIAQLNGEVRTPITVQLEALAGQIDTTIYGPASRVQETVSIPVTETSRQDHLPLTMRIPEGGTARCILDMGGIVSGMVEFEVDAPAGTVFDLAYLEEPLQPRRNLFGMHAGTRYIARGTDDRFKVFDSNGLRYAYILMHGTPGPVTVKQFAVQESLYPWETGASFESDDEELNRIYRAGIRTVALNSHDAFIDCPTREQRAWVGDGVVHQMVHLATNRDWRLAWHYLTLGNSPRSDGILPMSVAGDIEWSRQVTIPDWSLHWVHGVYNLYRFSGDRAAVKQLMPTIDRILRWYTPYQTADGVLKDVTEWNLIDWSSVSVEDTSAIITALWARGLREYAEMARWLEERSSQAWAEALYERIRSGFEVFWDEARGSYIDHIKNGVPQPEMSQLAGAAAIVSDLAPSDRRARIVATITDPQRLVVRSWTGGGGEYAPEKMQKQMQGIYEPDWDVAREIVLAEPFMSYLVHDAVAHAGKADLLPDLYRRWSEFLVDGYDTIGECWGWGTHVHGWSCTPARDMIFYTLGVTPAEPGYATARIAPRLGRLTAAAGKVPTPHGMITVEVRGDTIQIDTPVPAIVDLAGQPPRSLPAGKHTLPATSGSNA